jgi:hypothetical protein
MPHRLLRLVPLIVVAFALAGATNASAAKKAGCDSQVNDTAAKLLPCITQPDLTGYMNDFWQIALANPGPDGHPSRNSGEPGYLASVMYVKKLMDQWGYATTIQTYTFPYFAFVGTPSMSELSPTAHDFVLNADFSVGQAAASRPPPSTGGPGSSSRRRPRRAPRAGARRPTSPGSQPATSHSSSAAAATSA